MQRRLRRTGARRLGCARIGNRERRDFHRWLLARLLGRGATRRLLARAGAGPLARRALRAAVLEPFARRLGAAATPAHRALAAELARALAEGDGAAALALASTAARGPDVRAEKVLSHRHRFLWICNPKAGSRSLIAALRAADPTATLIRDLSLDEVYARYPEARAFFSFAFLRHPAERTRSCHADKHGLARCDPDAYRWFIEPYHGLRPGMSLAAFCRWLDTPCGADAFADRHWLSQSRQIATADGRLPDFLGRCERLETDWRTVAGRLGLPPAPLPRLNASRSRFKAALDGESAALLRRRYAADFALGGYGEAP